MGGNRLGVFDRAAVFKVGGDLPRVHHLREAEQPAARRNAVREGLTIEE